MSSVQLIFRNDNQLDHIVRIYRGQPTLDLTNPPPPIATLPGGSELYVDEDILSDTDYEYAVSVVDSSSEVFSYKSAIKTGGFSILPVLLDNNAVFEDECNSVTGWNSTNGSISLHEPKGLTLTKTIGAGSAAFMKRDFLINQKRDFLIFSKIKTTALSCMWILNNSKTSAIWFNQKLESGSTVKAQGEITLHGNDGSIVRTNPIHDAATDSWFEFALHFDSKFNTLNLYTLNNGIWIWRGRVQTTVFLPADGTLDFAISGAEGGGASLTVEYMYVCYPNLAVIGDSIAAGSTGFNPDVSLDRSNPQSQWTYNLNAYSYVKNSIVVNKGVGGQSSLELLNRVEDITSLNAKVCFLHASTNDLIKSVSQSDRTTNIEDTILAIKAASAKCVLLNAMYGTQAYNTTYPGHKSYMQNWWDNSSQDVGADVTIDISTPVLDEDGYMNVAITQSDGIHPNIDGYAAIAMYINNL